MTWIYPGEVALRAGVKTRTVQRWCRNQWIDHHRTPGGRFRFTEEEADAAVERHAAQERHPEVRTPNPDFDPTSFQKVTRIDRGRRGAA